MLRLFSVLNFVHKLRFVLKCGFSVGMCLSDCTQSCTFFTQFSKVVFSVIVCDKFSFVICCQLFDWTIVWLVEGIWTLYVESVCGPCLKSIWSEFWQLVAVQSFTLWLIGFGILLYFVVALWELWAYLVVCWDDRYSLVDWLGGWLSRFYIELQKSNFTLILR